MHQLKREVDRALRARWQKGPESFRGEDHRALHGGQAVERAIHRRQLDPKFNFPLRGSMHGPQDQQKLTTAARTGVEGMR
jgi:hypothetical protein